MWSSLPEMLRFSRAIESVRLGVKDFLTKPFEIETLVEAIKRHDKIRTKVKESFEKIDSSKEDNSDFIATSPELDKALTIARKRQKPMSVFWFWVKAASEKSFLPIMCIKIHRELKKHLSRLIWQPFPKIFWKVNCSAMKKGRLPMPLVKKGYFEVADGGTLF